MHIKEFTEPSFVHESLICGYLWANPNTYQKYKNHTIRKETFTNDTWYFYFTLGQELYNNGIRTFDDQTVYTYVLNRPKEVGKKSYVDAYNGFGAHETISEVMEACASDANNDDYHFSEIQKYESLRKMQDFSLIDINDKKLINTLCKLPLNKLELYLKTKMKEAFAQVNSGEVIEHDLASNLFDTIDRLDAGETMGMQLHDSPRLNRKIKGWKDGALYYLVLSSGVGKSSIAMEKFILGIIESGEKAQLAINEESVEKWRQLLLTTVSNKILKKKINREKVYEGHFDADMMQKLKDAASWAESKGKGLIKTLELKRYRLEDIISRIELYRARGYNKLIIDTFKPDRSSNDMARWEAFSNSAQELHDTIKEDNYNVGTLATVQLKIGKEVRFLDLDCIGKSMEIAEVAAVVMMGRLMYDDEFEGKYKLNAYNYEQDKLTHKWFKVPYELDKEKEYLILFLAKNRHGSEEEQIIYEVNYSLNQFSEVAYVKVPRYGN